MLNISKILVGVDLSHGDWHAAEDCESPSHFACEQAIALAAALQRQFNTKPNIHFLATLDLDERSKRLIARTPEGETTALDLANKAIQQQVHLATEAGVTATSEVVMGPPRTELVERTRRGAADLVIVGTRGFGLLSGMVMGSTGMALIHHAECPVWIAKPHDSDVPERILVATDFSPTCDRLLDYGIELAQLFSAELHVIHVVGEAQRSFLQLFAVDQETMDREQEDMMRDARGKFEAIEVRAEVRQLQPPAVFHLETGVANRVILDKTKELAIDLLLMGCVAWNGVSGVLLGSTAQKLLPSLDCSLLTLRDAPSGGKSGE